MSANSGLLHSADFKTGPLGLRLDIDGCVLVYDLDRAASSLARATGVTDFRSL